MAVIVGAVFTFIKGSEFYKDLKSQKGWKLVSQTGDAVAAAVTRTYTDKVTAMKREAQKEGKKLSEDQIKEIQEYALKAYTAEVTEMAKKHIGVKELTPTAILTLIEQEVRRRKGALEI